MATRSVQPQAEQPGKFQPTLPGIDFAPPPVRARLVEMHRRPAVSRGRRPDGGFGPVIRVAPRTAFADYPEMQLGSTGASCTALLLDIDRPTAYEETCGLVLDGLMAWPNWVAESKATGHIHVAWGLRTPVHTGPQARAQPLRYSGRIAEWLAHVTDADAGYNAFLTHNPVFDSLYRTFWLEEQPYTLADLYAFVPATFRIPKQPRTEYGRNCELYRLGSKWAGYLYNLDRPALDYLRSLNADYLHPLPEAEVRGIARSVERQRQRDLAKGWHRPDFFGRQRARGQRSGQARRTKSADRDRKILDLHGQGLSQVAIAKEVDMTRQGVAKVLERTDAQRPEPELESGRAAREREREASVLAMHGHGIGQRRIAAAHGVSLGKVQRLIRAVEKQVNRGATEPTQDRVGKRSDPDVGVSVCPAAETKPESDLAKPESTDGEGVRGRGGRKVDSAACDADLAALAAAADRRRRQVDVRLN